MEYARSPDPGSRGLRITAWKDEDLTGVQINIRLIPGAPTLPSKFSQMNVSHGVIVDRWSIDGSYGDGSPDSYSKPKEWEDFGEAIEKATAAPAETPYTISVSLGLR